MDLDLAANRGEIANPEGAANEGESAPPLAVQDAASAEHAEPAVYTDDTGKGWTRKVAQRIKEERERARQDLIAELFDSPEACEAYRTERRQQAAQQVEAQEAALYAELALAADPVLGEHFLTLEEEVRNVAERYDADLESAFLLVLREKLPELLQAERQKGEQQLLQKLEANGMGPGSLAAGPSGGTGVFALDEGEFSELVARVKRGEWNRR